MTEHCRQSRGRGIAGSLGNYLCHVLDRVCCYCRSLVRLSRSSVQRELEDPSGAALGANLRAAADLLHQAVDQHQSVAVAIAVVGEAYPVVTESDGGLVRRRGFLQGDADRALAVREGVSIAV